MIRKDFIYPRRERFPKSKKCVYLGMAVRLILNAHRTTHMTPNSTPFSSCGHFEIFFAECSERTTSFGSSGGIGLQYLKRSVTEQDMREDPRKLHELGILLRLIAGKGFI